METGIMFPPINKAEDRKPFAIFYKEKIEFYLPRWNAPLVVEKHSVDCDVTEVYRRLKAGRQNIIYRSLQLHVDFLTCSYSGGIDYELPVHERDVTFTLMLGVNKSYDILITDFYLVVEALGKLS